MKFLAPPRYVRPWLSDIELDEIQRNAENGHSEVDIRVTSDDNDSTQMIELEITEETVEHEAVAETVNSAGIQLSE